MGTITGRFHSNPLKTATGVAETRLTVEELPKGHNTGKKISCEDSKNPLWRLKEELQRQDCIYGPTDGRCDGWTDGPIIIIPFD